MEFSTSYMYLTLEDSGVWATSQMQAGFRHKQIHLKGPDAAVHRLHLFAVDYVPNDALCHYINSPSSLHN